ncbi:MAG: C/D box methylation guide ribonucleoprotein complex aNOP56 subunit [Candidatus Lokiarchaeota archaeon]|nr:C/D box methylation guide ribonucleoprotein complex aNOP56 subunit [Candidatus Lokiarchaeota archaeon]
MKSYIADTLCGIFAFDESGNILNFIDFEDDKQKIIQFYEAINEGIIQSVFEDFLLELKNSGFDEFIFDNKDLHTLTSQTLGYKTELKSISLELKDFRLNLLIQLKKVGIIKTKDEILAQYKEINEELSKKKVSLASGHSDNMIIQIISILDVIKKSISLLSSHLREWYGLHFPELTDKVIDDNMLLAKMISTLGAREKFTYENLRKNFELSDNKINILQEYASNSMGANFNLKLVQDYASQILSLDSYSQDLEERLTVLMTKSAPNINAIIGSLIGAKLIAKAGGLRKLAFMPASRIQLLGAEKALYRFLKTGEKRPKHGLIFQWNQIRGSKYYHRGKIARVVAGKIGIAAKVDNFNGDFIGDELARILELKIKEIEEKYPNPPKKTEPVNVRKSKPKKRR